MPESFSPPQRVAVCYYPQLEGARKTAQRLADLATSRGRSAWVGEMPDPDSGNHDSAFAGQLADADVLICVGGDGTVLHAAEYAAPHNLPLLGVRMGRLGFLTEVAEERADEVVGRVLDGEGRLESRATIKATIDDRPSVFALNEVIIGRKTIGQTVSVTAHIDGELVAEYRADAVVVATATGSTGYSLSAGGPILSPRSEEMILVPVSPHLTRANPLVLPSDTRLQLHVARGHQAVMTVDGHNMQPVSSGTDVDVRLATRRVSFIRMGGESEFYRNLAQRLQWLRRDYVGGDDTRPARD